MEERFVDSPFGRISMDPDVAIHHVLPNTRKNDKITLYNTSLALEHVQEFSGQGSILAQVVTICVAALVRIIQVISRANILIGV